MVGRTAPAFSTSRFMFILILSFIFVPVAHGEVYRIDSQAAFDELTRYLFQPGDEILLRSGATFSGSLTIDARGTETAPILIGGYGGKKRPRIDALGIHRAAIQLRNPSWITVDGIEVTNTDGTDVDQGELFGIYAIAEGIEGVYHDVTIRNCDVHHVNGKVAGKRRGGIHAHVRDLRRTRFDNLHILRNHVHHIGGVGIGNDSSCGKVELSKNDYKTRNLWTGVHVADNVVDTTGRNNVIARSSKDAVYERNILANSSRYDTGHSIFCFHTDGIKFQYNEAYGNVGEGGMDRGGFDADYNCVNTYIQYNYSHDNLWFCGIMKKANRHVVIRYNVSQNDRAGIYFYGFEKENHAEDIHIYNNTHFVRDGLDVRVFAESRTPLNTTFENNVFYFAGKGLWGGKNSKGVNTLFRNNLYFNLKPHPSETKPLIADPRFLSPGEAGRNIDLTSMQALVGYRPQPESPCINTGIPIKNQGGFDILGHAVDARSPDLGAFESR